jgi:hypothetical protein
VIPALKLLVHTVIELGKAHTRHLQRCRQSHHVEPEKASSLRRGRGVQYLSCTYRNGELIEGVIRTLAVRKSAISTEVDIAPTFMLVIQI